MVRGLSVLRTGSLAAMLNVEFAGHPLHDCLELQWFDNAEHGTDRQPRCRRLPAKPACASTKRTTQIGAGVGVWAEADFEEARLEVSDGGVRGRRIARSVGYARPTRRGPRDT